MPEIPEFAGAEITRLNVDLEGNSRFECFKIVLPSGETRLVPQAEENADYQRIKLWNADNGNPLNLEN